MLERETGNRGSKSPRGIVYKESSRLALNHVLTVMGLTHLGVKEQRVDGSYKTEYSVLRYTLRGFERNSLARIPSNLNINKRIYSTINTSQQSLKPFSIKKSTEEKISTQKPVLLKSSLNP